MKKALLNRVETGMARWCCAVLIIVSGCSSRKHIVLDNSKIVWKEVNEEVRADFFANLPESQTRFETLNARGKGLLTINNKEQHEVGVQIRMEMGKSIWASVTALLGMEVARVLITPDSVQVINRLDAEYWGRPFSDLHKFVGDEVDFESLQQLLQGNVDTDYYHYSSRDRLSRSEAGVFWLKRARGLSEADLYVNSEFRMQTWMVRDTGPRTFEVNHAYQADYFPVRFPRKTSMSVKSGLLALLATIDYNRLVLDQPVAIPFSIPNGYRHVY